MHVVMIGGSDAGISAALRARELDPAVDVTVVLADGYALGGNRQYAGSLGTQVVKIFDQAAARTGLRDHEARSAGFAPVTVASAADDHKAYYPGSHRITMRVTGDRATGRLLGLQLFGHRHAEIAKREISSRIRPCCWPRPTARCPRLPPGWHPRPSSRTTARPRH